MRRLRFGVNCTTTSAGEWLEAARKAEGLGFDTFIAQDHLGSQLAPLPALAAAAMVTSHLRLATLVLDNDFRHPALVAEEAVTVDVLSGGRMELGLGAGWLESDYTRAGIPFDVPAVRLERLAVAGYLEATQRWHASYYLALAEKAEPHLRGGAQRDWLDRLETEQDNLRAAL